MESKKKRLTGTDAVILFGIVFFASFIGFSLFLNQVLLNIAKVFTLVLAGLSKNTTTEDVEEINRAFLMESIKNWGIFLVYLIFVIFTIIYACKDKLGLPSIIMGILFGVYWIIDIVDTFDKTFKEFNVISIFALISLVLCVSFGIKKYIDLKRQHKNKPELTTDNV